MGMKRRVIMIIAVIETAGQTFYTLIKHSLDGHSLNPTCL